MRKFSGLFLLLCLLPMLAVAAPDPKATQALHALFDADWQRQLQENPINASFLGDDRYNDRWPDLSRSAIQASEQAVRDSRTKLLAIDRNALSDADQLNYDIYRYQLD